jgi:hypothetical protein
MTQHRAARSRRDAVVAILGSAAGLGGAVALTRLDTEVLEPAGLSAEPAASTVVVAAHDAGDRFRATADYACDGQDDHEEIRRAVKACPDGGLVLLSPGTFRIAQPIPLTSRVALQGAGRSTVLQADGTWTAGDGTRPGGVVELADGATHRTALRHLTVDGGESQALCKGVYYNVDSYSSRGPTGPDPVHLIEDVHVLRTGGTGVHLAGGTNRSNLVTGVRVFRAGDRSPADGLLFECFDSFVTNCESGAASGDGFRVRGANNRLTACKSWYSRRNGFHVDGVRNQFAVCESQDNERHGYYLPTGPASLVGCVADSNGRPAAGGPAGEFDGFHLPFSEAVQCVGCQSYDRREGGRSTQRYGYYLGAESRDCQIIGVARHNVAAAAAGKGLSSPGTLVSVTGGGRGSGPRLPSAVPEFEIDEGRRILRVRLRDSAGAVRTAEVPLT